MHDGYNRYDAFERYDRYRRQGGYGGSRQYGRDDARSAFGSGPCARETAAGLGAQLLLLALLWAVVGLGPAGWLTGSAFAFTTWTVLTLALRRSHARALGPANRVTLARTVLVGGVTALVADSFTGRLPVPALVALATVALVLDAVDGQVARRTRTASPLGARFDMEVDAFLILVLSVLVAVSLGAWVLLIGAMRYAFVAADRALPWLREPLPPSTARKTVAALQGIVLLVAASGVLPFPAAFTAVLLALALLVWSFSRDIAWLWHRKTSAPRPHCGLLRAPRGPRGRQGRPARAPERVTRPPVPALACYAGRRDAARRRTGGTCGET